MIKLMKLNLLIGIIMLFASCATSMTPIQVNNTLPTLTKSKFISQAQAEEAVRTNRCKYLVKGRNYTVPIGLTVKDDLKNGAKGIDEWVTIDGGNTYVLINYKWITVNNDGATQLHIEFDTMLCE
ncbi:MAG: hypothetical protein FWF52_09520 [Candidatus Azobacteroides sp.]|nr:hypothetical protein [Candidatus Azobacteroides sp.]